MTPTAKDYREAAKYLTSESKYHAFMCKSCDDVYRYHSRRRDANKLAARACREMARGLSKTKQKK